MVFPGIRLPANSKRGVNEGASLGNGGFGGTSEVTEPPEELLSFEPKLCKKPATDGTKYQVFEDFLGKLAPAFLPHS